MNCALSHTSSCDGPLDRHHVVQKRWLKDRFPHGAVWDADRALLVPLARAHCPPVEALVSLDRLLSDERNLAPLCRTHHEKVTNHRLAVVPSQSVWEFAGETGLDAKLDKALERVVASGLEAA